MPFPRWFMRQTATLTTQLASQETAGSWDQGASVTYTCRCNLQPNSSNDAAIYRKETSTTLYTLYLMPKCTDGTATASVINKVTSITIDGVDYGMTGEPLDLCSNGSVIQCGVFREV